ncbi:MAG: hypothetical protein C4522_19930 [Desulfobacteraceae bacterium]|nr:MAG: hypothetical protein C4522_19930 [Desulfobacteraceae bacterium]
MAKRVHLSNEKEADVERSSDDIRRDIAKEKENISQKVDQIGERIKEKFDWHEYVKESPYLAIGVAAGLGYIGSRIFISRPTPMERIMDSIAGEVRGSLGGLSTGPGLIKLTLLGIATKVAAGWIKSSTSTEVVNNAAGPRPPAGHGSTVGPRAGN